jgi:hypothetical protein
VKGRAPVGRLPDERNPLPPEYAWSDAAWSGIMILFPHGNLIGK